MTSTTPFRYAWARGGDVNAFFGLMLDNVTVLVVLFTVIVSDKSPAEQDAKQAYGFTVEFVLTRMVPGTALGVLLGDLVYTWLAFRLARRLGRSDVTAMPLGLDTPSTIGTAFFVLLPALKDGHRLGLGHEEAMFFAWRVAVVVLLFIGAFKVLFAPLGNAVRRWVPQAGLLGSLAAIALVLIAFVPLLDGIASLPIVGMVALTIILVTLVAHRALPGRFPGALAAVLVGLGLYWACVALGSVQGVPLVPAVHELPSVAWRPPPLLSALLGGETHWDEVIRTAFNYLPIAVPFALVTIVGGIDCTESAAAAGDEYDTRSILLTEGVASLVAAGLGGVIQTTPYIGQPAYKAMGGRAAYTLATALFIGAAGVFGWFTHLFEWLPRAAMFPILVFVGLEITAQSFRATAPRHYAALAVAVLPALAALANICVGRALGPQAPAGPEAEVMVLTLRCLASGFIVTSLLWAASLAALLDGRPAQSAAYLGVAAVCALFGVMHSPLPDSPIAWPGDVLAQLPDDPALRCQSPYHWAAAYVLCALVLMGLACFRAEPAAVEDEGKVATRA